MGQHKQLCACLGFSVRLARKEGRHDVATGLWQILYSLAHPQEDIRVPISLHASLGFGNAPMPQLNAVYQSPMAPQAESCGGCQAIQTDTSVQTSEEMLSQEECRALLEKITENVVSSAQESLRALQYRLETLEAAGRRAETVESGVSSTEVGRRSIVGGCTNLPPTCSTGSSLPIPSSCAPDDLCVLRAQHKAQRLAQKTARRQARLNANAESLDP